MRIPDWCFTMGGYFYPNYDGTYFNYDPPFAAPLDGDWTGDVQVGNFLRRNGD